LFRHEAHEVLCELQLFTLGARGQMDAGDIAFRFTGFAKRLQLVRKLGDEADPRHDPLAQDAGTGLSEGR
jgi:hypothetical protein